MAHGLQCYCCGAITTSDAHYLCYACAKRLTHDFNNSAAKIIDNPSSVYHCIICGEYENRRIADEMMPICDKCVVDELFEYEK